MSSGLMIRRDVWGVEELLVSLVPGEDDGGGPGSDSVVKFWTGRGLQSVIMELLNHL